MKKIDKYVLYNFLGPFAVSFGIATFVLVMQFLWLYIDEIAGKGINIFLLLELIAYKSIALFPLALPIAVLIATVMAMGNMAERHELPSLKSAGISLPRILYSLVFAAACIAGFSYCCSNFKSWTKVWDMKEFDLVRGAEGRLIGQKGMLSMEQLRINMDSLHAIVQNGGQTI